MKTFKIFIIVYLIGTIASLIPFLWCSVLIGQPAVILSSLLVTLFIKNGVLRNET